jgi:hypothetical protein
MSQADFLAAFETANLIDIYPGRQGKGDLFPADLARAAAKGTDLAAHDRVLFVGAGVARAFGFAGPVLRWQRFRGTMAAAMPHPSGINRWWNDAANVRRAARFMSRLAAIAAARHP